MNRIVSSVSIMLSALLLMAPSTASASAVRFWQCVTYAREVSGIDIHGNAKTWWSQAAGKYQRGNTPREGAVLALPGSGRMRLGHVAMVSKVLNDREILLTHANWSRRGKIERNVRAIDVSDAGDWSRVRIWFASNGDLGTTRYPASGFIYANGTAKLPDAEMASIAPSVERAPFKLSKDVIQLAMLER
jgi:surface antigen